MSFLFGVGCGVVGTFVVITVVFCLLIAASEYEREEL